MNNKLKVSQASKKTAYFNPFLIPAIFGQSICDWNYEPAGFFLVSWNFLYIIIYLIIFYFALISADREDITGPPGFSFISQIKYCVQLYGSAVFMCSLTIHTTYFRRPLLHSFHRLRNIYKDFEYLGIHSQQSKAVLVNTFCLIISVPLFIVFDIKRSERSISPLLWVCYYLPGLGNMIFFIDCIAFMRSCAQKFEMVNDKLKEFTSSNKLCLDVYLMRQRNVYPKALLRKFPGTNLNVLEKLMQIHNEVCEVTDVISKLGGFAMLQYFTFAAFAVLSFCYHFTLVIYSISLGFSYQPSNTLACDFWTIVNVIILFNVTTVTVSVDDRSQETIGLLHKLGNIYPELEKYVEIFSLQLIHQKAKITAAGYFPIDRSITYGLLSSFCTYFIVLLQFTND